MHPVNTVQSDLLHLNDRTDYQIVRSLTAEEADLEETGPMYVVRFSDGQEITVYEDEIDPAVQVEADVLRIDPRTGPNEAYLRTLPQANVTEDDYLRSRSECRLCGYLDGQHARSCELREGD